MLNSINITHIWVFDQNEALEFYVGKLGLEVSGDMGLGEMRWLTVRVPSQQGRDILLEKIGPPSVDPDAAQKLRELISKGASGFTAGFTTTNCQAVYEDLKKKGVEITQEPVTHFYGTDIGIRDPFGNHLRIVQLAEPPKKK
jgi:uncharacterized glyoxalase superfamily protein PhnB